MGRVRSAQLEASKGRCTAYSTQKGCMPADQKEQGSGAGLISTVGGLDELLRSRAGLRQAVCQSKCSRSEEQASGAGEISTVGGHDGLLCSRPCTGCLLVKLQQIKRSKAVGRVRSAQSEASMSRCTAEQHCTGCLSALVTQKDQGCKAVGLFRSAQSEASMS